MTINGHYTLPHESCWVLWFHIGVHLSVVSYVPLPDFCFRRMTWENVNRLSPNLVNCELILWRSDLGLRMGKFCQFLAELPACESSVFLFLDNNLSKSQWIFTKFDMCIDIVEIWFGIDNGQISTIFSCPWHDNGGLLSFHVFIFLYNQCIFVWILCFWGPHLNSFISGTIL